jgi:cell division protein FtsQ
MRSLKVDRKPRTNPRAKAGRAPARPAREAARAPREKTRSTGAAATGIKALISRPMLLLGLSLTIFAVLAALLVSGVVGRGVRAFNRTLDAIAADAGFGISDIHITGTGRTPYASVIEALGMKPGESIFGANLTAAYQRLSHLPWVASVDVQRRYPDAIFVTIVEKRPFALWQLPPDANGQSRIAVVERSGAVITTEGVEKFARLPKLVGPGAPSQGAADLVDAVASHRAVAARIAAYERQSQRRWNLILNDGVVVKLPETGWARELDTLEKLIIDDGVLERDVTEIDLRSPTHIFFMLKGGDHKDVVRGKET